MNRFSVPPKSLPPGSKVFGYTRDSGGDEQELSVERQMHEITAWAEYHHITITKWFVDEARSGRTLKKREDLKKLLEVFRAGNIEERGVLVWSYDRFARNALHSQMYRSEIRERGYVFHSVSDNIPEGKESIVYEAMKEWAAEEYSERLSINVKSGSREVLLNHKVMGGFPPRGFKREPVDLGSHRNGKPRIAHKWIPDPDLIPTIRLAFEMRARGATLHQIMLATKLFTSINSFRTFFNNRLYLGILEYGELVIENYCQPIISIDLWNKVQEISQIRKNITAENNPRRFASQFILSGLIICQHCGAPLNGHVIAKIGKPRRDYYACSRKTRRRDCPAREIPARALENHILNKLENLALDLEFLLNFQTRVAHHHKCMYEIRDGERLKLRADLRKQNQRINNLTNAIAERGHSRSLLIALQKAESDASTLKLQLDQLESELQTPKQYTPAQLNTIAEELKSALHGDDIHNKKHAIHMLTSRIIASRVDDAIHGVLYYIPNVFIGRSTPMQVYTEGIHFSISIPKYTLQT